MISEALVAPKLDLQDNLSPAAISTPSRNEVTHWVEHAAHYLPAQGPIEVFVHHNTLHAFADHSFHDAVRLGWQRYGAEPYLTELEFRRLRDEGRISDETLEAVLMQDLGNSTHETINGLGSRIELRLAMLRHPLHAGPDAELRWIIAETDALTAFREQVSVVNRGRMVNSALQYLKRHGDELKAEPTFRKLLSGAGKDFNRLRGAKAETFAVELLWSLCSKSIKRLHNGAEAESHSWIRPRDAIYHASGHDIDRVVEDVLIKLSAAYVDQGYSASVLPNRDRGFLAAFNTLYRDSGWTMERWLRPLPEWIRRFEQDDMDAAAIIAESISDFGVESADAQEFISQSLLALGGWAGMIQQLETGVDWVVHQLPKGSLLDFLAVRLVLERLAIRDIAIDCSIPGAKQSITPTWQLVRNLSRSSQSASCSSGLRETFLLFQVAQLLGWTPMELDQLSDSDWRELHNELTRFDGLQRRKIFQEAMEREYRFAALDAISATASAHASARSICKKEVGGRWASEALPSFQIVTCIDDREESFRRNMEEVDPACETFGAAGFFAVAMYYRGSADAFYKPLCPGVITPAHYVQEDVGYTFEGVHESRTRLRSRLGTAGFSFATQSRNVLGGVVAGVAGSLATAPLIARVLFPRLTSRIRQRFGMFFQTPPVTSLHLQRYEDPPGPDGPHIGYSVDEMAGIVVRLLGDIGVCSPERMSRLFIVCGHGSSSLNNPHESAYCCGACAGKRGGPNARAFAAMANDYRVREKVRGLGVSIPDDTFFIGAYHNTCDDSVVFFDLDRLPPSHRDEFEATRKVIEETRARNAHERCRRFGSAPLNMTFSEALRHVEARAEDLSQARPEYNHATNALCIVGRRHWTRGLFLDRRAFLTSYDPASDDAEHSVLKRILAAAVPVCAGINLEYYFSRVDHGKYGSGSKLPHNLVGLVGVMEGTSSDLRTGLYQQMVEIHDPLRITFVIEATPETMQVVMESNPAIAGLVQGGWVHLATVDPDTAQVQRFELGEFVQHETTATTLPTRVSSLACYKGNRGNIPFASVDSGGHC